MAPVEVRTRIRDALRLRYERRLWLGNAHRGSAIRPSGDWSKPDIVSACRSLVRGSHPTEIQNLAIDAPQQFVKLTEACANSVQCIFAGAWPMLGHNFDLTATVDWHKDPRSEFRFAKTFYGDVRIDEPGVDVKYVWELGRFQFVTELAQAWTFSRNADAVCCADRLWDTWIAQNPLCEGVHWTSALEVAMRAISWTWALAGIGDRADMQAGLLQRITASLVDHANYLQHHFSFYSSPFNHLVGEASGLYVIACVLHDHPQSAQWQTAARQVLEQHGPRQFYRDGLCVEQACGYHFYTLGFLSMAIVAARSQGQPLTSLEPIAHKAFRAGALLRQPNGRWPSFGDLDSARALPVHHADYWRFGSLCSLAAVLFDDAELAFEEDPGAELYWLLGCDGLTAWQRLKGQSHNSVASGNIRGEIFADAGYVVAASEDDWFLFDAGPIAEGLFEDTTPSVAHGHADTLQVLYWSQGRDVLLDAGMPYSVGKAGVVDYFRSPAAHNTLSVSGAPVAKVAGQLAWSNVCRRPLLEARLSEQESFAHGRLELPGGIVIDRYVLAMAKNGVWITDSVRSTENCDATWYWQLGNPTFDVASTERSLQLVSGTDVCIKLWCDAKIDWEMHAANDQDCVGWVAQGYGSQIPGKRLSVRVEKQKQLLLTTFVGRATASARLEQVRTQGLTLDCEMIQDQAELQCQGDDAFEIRWTLSEGARSSVRYAVPSSSASHHADGDHEIAGSGDWRVLRRERTQSTQSSTA